MAALIVTPLSQTLSVAGQISPEDLTAIAAAGFKSVLCNRPDGESPGQCGWQVLATAARQAGLAMVYLPVVSGRVTEEHGREFGAAVGAVTSGFTALARTRTARRTSRVQPEWPGTARHRIPLMTSA